MVGTQWWWGKVTGTLSEVKRRKVARYGFVEIWMVLPLRVIGEPLEVLSRKLCHLYKNPILISPGCGMET